MPVFDRMYALCPVIVYIIVTNNVDALADGRVGQCTDTTPNQYISISLTVAGTWTFDLPNIS
jgi:hypothetical protein